MAAFVPEATEPFLVVVFGPTGAGKSTLVNSLAGRTVSASGVLRPTTVRPAVVCRPADAQRARRIAGTVVEDEGAIFERVWLVDTPDVDSDLVELRVAATELLAAADAAIYVTTPLRYGDAVPHGLAVGVLARIPTLLVVNRSGRRSTGAVTDLASRIRVGGHPVSTADIVVVAEQRLVGGGRLPGSATGRIRSFLESLAQR